MIRTHAKKAPNDLLDAETSKPVTAEVREAMTQALDHNSVKTLLGRPDHDRLVAGGRQLMKGQGDLADIVFEAEASRTATCAHWWPDSKTGQLNFSRHARTPTSILNPAQNASREELDGRLKATMATAEEVDAAAARRTTDCKRPSLSNAVCRPHTCGLRMPD